MRTARILADQNQSSAVYHVISRVVDRQFVLGDEEREQFVRFMRMYARFGGVEILTFCVMSNHFHLLVEVPSSEGFTLSDEEILERCSHVYSEAALREIRWKLTELCPSQGGQALAEFRESLLYRMNSLSEFMKTLKQRFTQWFNKKHGRRGTLWEDRFKSVLVENSVGAIDAMAAYIDLNPVRAGMVEDPKDYRWCGYGEAVGSGCEEAVCGLARVVEARGTSLGVAGGSSKAERKRVLAEYRVALFGRAERTSSRKGVTEARVEEVLAAKGQLRRHEWLLCRVRYFSDGVVIGSRGFVEGFFEARRERFGPKR
ncbi:MAG: transposase, partial [Verrucomicrobiota bacterium]